jgi:rubrerythrin
MKPMTEANLRAAIAGESQAHVKYLAFAEQAEKDNKPNVARLFRAVAEAELRHATYDLRVLGEIGSTAENLKAAFAGEDHEVQSMYPAFTAVSELEGEDLATKAFHYAVEAEKQHRPLYNEAHELVEAGGDLDDTPIYVCGVCGHTGRGEAPDQCPVCNSPQKVFSIY